MGVIWQAPSPWHGRLDPDESGSSLRWHQRVRPWHAQARGGVVLIGFAVDEGVRRNQGRPGAAEGPAALRRALANLPCHGEPALWDAGDLGCEHGALEAAQAALAMQVAQARRQGALPLVMGGGHEMAWGTFAGLVQDAPIPSRLLILNLDAHFDLREAPQANSGTPFRQIERWCAAHGRPFVYRVMGISRFANTEALFARAEATGTRHWLDEALQTPEGWAAASHALADELRVCDAVYLTLCLDVFSAAVAPGVSAPGVLGVPLAWVETVLSQVAASGKLWAADVAELNPGFDRDGQTARVAARLLARLAREAG